MNQHGNETNDHGACKHVIVAGYGPVGRVVVDDLESADVEITIIELNRATVDRVLRQGRKAVYGDVTDPDALREAGIVQADALILAVPDEDLAVTACHVARELNPDIFIAARTNFLSKGLLATEAGADHVVIEEVVTAEAMQKAVYERLLGGVSPAAAERCPR